jgi:hypothetical protein
LNRNESGKFGALKSDSTHHFFRNACTKSGSHYKRLEDNKEIITSLKSKNNREHNGQNKNDKWKNNDLQITTQKTKDRAAQTPLITVG